MAAITSALLSTALSAGGSYFGNKSAKKAAKRQKKQLKRATDISRNVQETGFSQKGAAIRRGAEKQLGALSTAQTDINRALREREAVTQGQVSQSLANSGLSSTTIGANAKRAVSGDTSRALSDLMSQLAQARGGIEANREAQLGDLAMQRGGMLSDLALQEGQFPVFQGESAGEMAFGALGAGLGAYTGAGGGFGGMGGQQMQQQQLLDQIYRQGYGPNRSYVRQGAGGQSIPQSFVR